MSCMETMTSMPGDQTTPAMVYSTSPCRGVLSEILSPMFRPLSTWNSSVTRRCRPSLSCAARLGAALAEIQLHHAGMIADQKALSGSTPKNMVALGMTAAPIIANIGLANSGDAMAIGIT